jgi:hypothetical protein
MTRKRMNTKTSSQRNGATHTSLARLLVGLVLGVGMTAGCVAPFSDLQSARLAGPNRFEVTPSYSAVSFAEDGQREELQDNFGIQVATGISPRVDLRARYERISLKDSDGGVNVLGMGPKVGLVEDRVAIYLPVGFAFGSGIEASETIQVHPTLLATVPVHDFVELNGSVKALIPITERDIDDLVAFNIGLGLGPDLQRWVIRPEIGFLFNPGESGHFRHLSIGLTYYFERPQTAASAGANRP